MQNRPWESIHAVFEKLEALCGQLGRGSNEGAQADAGDKEALFINTRKKIRTHLDSLRAQLLEEMSERDVYFVLFPIVALFDEWVQTRFLDDNQTVWPPLQKELFQIDDAGEIFFESLDEILKRPQTLPLIYQIYYLCLSYGFKGRYNDNALKVNSYMKKLREKIAAPPPEPRDTAGDNDVRFRRLGSKAWYYAAAMVLLGVFYFLFYIVATIPGTTLETIRMPSSASTDDFERIDIDAKPPAVPAFVIDP